MESESLGILGRILSPLRLLLPSILLVPAAAQRPAPTTSAPTALGIGVHDLAGKRLEAFPHFHHVDVFNEGDTIQVALDPSAFPHLRGERVDLYVVEHGTASLGSPLVGLGGTPLTVKVGVASIKQGIFTVDAGTLPGATGTTAIATPYDLVVDVDRGGTLDAGDLLDGGGRPGFHVVGDLVQPGPYAVTEVIHNGGGFAVQDIYFPENVSELGELPLIVVSHGNGHQYDWYDHIGYHMASWGYVVMSHANNTGPGPMAASTTTLSNTNLLLGNLDTIAGGELLGHVDGHRIVWLGHSRGAEGVVIAYRRLLEGEVFDNFGFEDVRLVSSIAPTDFGDVSTDVGDVPYHLWTGGADNDVNGCANCTQCQTFHLHERADGERMSISLHGVGHGDFHDGGGPSVAAGPCRVGREQTHDIMRGYFLPLVKWVLDGDLAGKEFLWRQWEDLKPIGAPTDECVVVDLMYQEHPASGKLVLDDFQSNFDEGVSSSGGGVAHSLDVYVEGRFDDPNSSFNPSVNDPMNGMTLAGANDDSRGIAFEWVADEVLHFQVPAGMRDLSAYEFLSFRAAQSTRSPRTTAVLEDLDLTVQLIDETGRSSALRIGVYGGGIEEPYQRPRCGGMDLRGWANEFETIRIRLGDFRSDGRPLDLTRVAVVSFLFGPSYGAAEGRIGLDEIEFVQE